MKLVKAAAAKMTINTRFRCFPTIKRSQGALKELLLVETDSLCWTFLLDLPNKFPSDENGQTGDGYDAEIDHEIYG